MGGNRVEGMWRSIPSLRLPPWIEEPGGLQSMGLQRIRHDWVTEHKHKICIWGVCICKCMCLSMYIYIFNSVHCKDQEAKILVAVIIPNIQMDIRYIQIWKYLISKSWSLIPFFAELNQGSSKKWLTPEMEQSGY